MTNTMQSPIKRHLRRFVAITAVTLFAVFGIAATVSATTAPTITSTTASFVVPAKPVGTYVLNLWHNGHLVGSTTGTEGTLTVVVPDVPICTFQADVKLNDVWYAGTVRTFATCGPVASTTTTTTTTTTQPPVPVTPNATVTPPTPGEQCAAGIITAPECGVVTPAPKVAIGAPASASLPPTTSLAFTGTPADTAFLLEVGIGMLLLGSFLLFAQRRRNRHVG